jgi:hypothetical protein
MLFVPLTLVRPIEAEVPVKVNASPLPGQLSSRVAGFTRPRNWTSVTPTAPVEVVAGADAVEADVTVDEADVAA